MNQGQRWEEYALQHLSAQGLRLVQRNYHCRFGEIDLVMWHDSTLVFVEVRYRKSSRYGSAAESVTQSKRRRLLLTAGHYLQRQRLLPEPPCRFDVVAIGGAQGEAFEWIMDAFGE